jgi:hypothetical protein
MLRQRSKWPDLQSDGVAGSTLARQAGLTERYVGKVFGCAFLAPDIIESILEGRQPHDLNFEKPWARAIAFISENLGCRTESLELGGTTR